MIPAPSLQGFPPPQVLFGGSYPHFELFFRNPQALSAGNQPLFAEKHATRRAAALILSP